MSDAEAAGTPLDLAGRHIVLGLSGGIHGAHRAPPRVPCRPQPIGLPDRDAVDMPINP